MTLWKWCATGAGLIWGALIVCLWARNVDNDEPMPESNWRPVIVPDELEDAS